MNIQHASLAKSRPNSARLHVFPDKKDKIFSSDQREQFLSSANNYLEAYDQVGVSGAKKGAWVGAAVVASAALVGIGTAALLTGDTVTGLLLGTTLGVASSSLAGAVILPATIDGTRREAQDQFASNHPAPYLEAGPQKWLTADGRLMHDWNGQTSL